jgi:hypothetical protein
MRSRPVWAEPHEAETTRGGQEIRAVGLRSTGVSCFFVFCVSEVAKCLTGTGLQNGVNTGQHSQTRFTPPNNFELLVVVDGDSSCASQSRVSGCLWRRAIFRRPGSWWIRLINCHGWTQKGRKGPRKGITPSPSPLSAVWRAQELSCASCA